MTNKLFLVFLSFIIVYDMAYCQDTTVTNRGAYVQIIGSYVNISNKVISVELSHIWVDFAANIKGGLGVGTSLGYRMHGKGSIDGSIDIGYIYSSHRISYEYPPSRIIPTINPLLINNAEINKINLHTLSIDLGVYFFNQSRFQPHVKFGFAFLLKTIHLEATPFDFLTGHEPFLERRSYGFSNIYSGYSPHSGMGVSYYLTKNIALTGNISADWFFFNSTRTTLWPEEEFNAVNIGGSSSIMIFF